MTCCVCSEGGDMAWAVGSTLNLRAHDTCGNRLADIGFPYPLVRLADIADLAVAS